VVGLDVPRHFAAVGQFYRDFPQLDDREVIALLREPPASPPAPGTP
jgi:predicted phosphoribosyltransferase